jgi:capsule polysaccharide export protein KpsE/RkpR
MIRAMKTIDNITKIFKYFLMILMEILYFYSIFEADKYHYHL